MAAQSVCGSLDVGDRQALIPTTPVPPVEVEVALKAATGSDAFDGVLEAPPIGVSVLPGARTVAKAQHREHERLASLAWFDTLRTSAGIPAPALLDAGSVETASGPRWWVVLERIHAENGHAPRPARQRALGAQLRRWHELAPAHGLRLDDPGGLGVMLGTPRALLATDNYLAISHVLAEACRGQPMAAIHSDVAVGHNTMFHADALAAILDPGAVHVGPPMLDLAWCLAIDLPHGADPAPLLDGYGRDAVDIDALGELLPHLMLRRLIDTVLAGNDEDTGWLTRALRARAPRLLASAGLPDCLA
jgi:hypothetical protein